MRTKLIAICGVTTILVAGATRHVNGQVVQLPTFQTFSVATTVLVPDRGSMMLGGVDRAAFGSAAFGMPGAAGLPGAGRLFGNQAIGGQVQASRLNASATIIDLQELDQAVRNQAAGAVTQPANPAVTRKAAFLAQHIARNGKVAASQSPPRARPANSNEPSIATFSNADAESEARAAFQRAAQAEARGQWATARVNYKRAATLSRGALRTEALARLSALTPTKDLKSTSR